MIPIIIITVAGAFILCAIMSEYAAASPAPTAAETNIPPPRANTSSKARQERSDEIMANTEDQKAVAFLDWMVRASGAGIQCTIDLTDDNIAGNLRRLKEYLERLQR